MTKNISDLGNQNPIQQKLSILKWRLHRIFITTPNGWLYNLVSFYRSYEPQWLAKQTCQSYKFQLKLDEVVNAYLKETKTKVHQETYCDPGQTTNGTYIIKKNGWSDETDNRGRIEQEIWKQGFDNAVFNIWGLSNYPNAWKQNARHQGQWDGMAWQYHYCNSFIKNFYGDYCEFTDKKPDVREEEYNERF
tara:strand:+ start:44 stop:616 length:573 start_codon:yes stop_codon:yes gene_type:complete